MFTIISCWKALLPLPLLRSFFRQGPWRSFITTDADRAPSSSPAEKPGTAGRATARPRGRGCHVEPTLGKANMVSKAS